MELTTLTYFDLGVFTILGLSGLLSFFRGFVREVLSLGAWFGAGVITLYAFPHVAAVLSKHIQNQTIASGLAALSTFALALIAISVVSSVLLKFVKSGSDVGLLDHFMGLMFGIARGVLMVAIAYFIYAQIFVAKEDYPDWVQNAVTRPYVAKAANAVAKLAPSYLGEIADKDDKKNKKKVSEPNDWLPEDDIDEAVKNTTPNEPIEWPSADDLKQRVKNATE
jgi:membrane protein required for colicin V production